MMDDDTMYYDTDYDGIPDVFQNRLPISEILNCEPTPAQLHDTIVVEIEKKERAPRKGEYFFVGSSCIQKADFDYGGSTKFMIIKRIVAGTLEGYGE